MAHGYRDPVETLAIIGETYFRPAIDAPEIPEHFEPAYSQWMAEHPDFTSVAAARTQEALEWLATRPADAYGLLRGLDRSIAVLNRHLLENDPPYSVEVFPNMARWQEANEEPLPLVLEPSLGISPGTAIAGLAKAARFAGTGFRLGETINPPGDPTVFTFQNCLNNPEVPTADRARFMVAAALDDLYEEFIYGINRYPNAHNEEAVSGGLLVCGLVEAAFVDATENITSPNTFFNTLADPRGEWIVGYDAFSDRFQDITRMWQADHTALWQ